MAHHERELSAAKTAIADEPIAAAQPSPAGALGLAVTTAAPNHRIDRGNDSLVSGATLRSDGAPSVSNGQLPHTIGRFLVLGKLGAGGMGVVVEAYDPELDRKVAVKILQSNRGRSQSQARLLREAQAMARVSHPNVVHVYDVGMLGEQVFIAMELVVGQTLTQWLAVESRTWPEVLVHFIAAGQGLAAAHRAGLVHRDFKPDNVLIADDGRVRVADFGLAREGLAQHREMMLTRDDNPGTRPLLANTLTATGAVMGTPMYMSPEQHLGETAGVASDIFSFSVALFEGLYGIRPFQAETLANLTDRVLNGQMADPPKGHPIPRWLDAVVRRGLAVDPDKRWPNFESYLEALTSDVRRRRRQYLGLGAVVLSAGVLGGALQAQSTPAVCASGAQAVDEMWGKQAQVGVRQQLAKLPQELRQTIEPRVVEGLSAYAHSWVEHEREACLGYHRGERTDRLFDAQSQCFDLRRQAFSRAVSRISTGDANTLREATMIVAKLPQVADCTDQTALLAKVPPPADPDLAATVKALRGRLVELDVDANAGDPLAVLDELDQLRTEVEELDYRPLLAELDLQRGRIALEVQAWDRSVAALSQAFIHATATSMDDIAAEAKARYLFVAGRAEPTVALAQQDHVYALIDRIPGRDDLRALVENNLGAVMAMTGDRKGARHHIGRAIELASDNPRVRPIDLATGYLLNLATLSEQGDDQKNLYKQALEILDAEIGPQHPEAINARRRAGSLAGSPVDAERLLAPTCPRLLDSTLATAYENCFECFHRLGHVLVDLGRDTEAVASATSGLTCFDRPIAEADREVVQAYTALLRGRKHLYAGEYTQSEAPLAEARQLFEPYGERWWIALWLADIDLADGRRLLATGDAEGAIVPLESAIATFTSLRDKAFDDLPQYGLARAQVALAMALVAPSREHSPQAETKDTADTLDSAMTRAHALVSEAEAFYRRAGPGYADRLATLETWRSENPK